MSPSTTWRKWPAGRVVRPLEETAVAVPEKQMAENEYKKYTDNARRGIKGEAFFESLVVDHAIPHRIARQNDLGIDFLCEWVHGDRPTGILFSAQIKTTTSERVKCKSVGRSRLNGLEEYILTGAEKVDERTINYWQGLGLPAFLFIIIEQGSHGASRLGCYYKRYTPLLDGCPNADDENGTKSFYQVNNEATFLAFADSQKEIGGFARDLIIDYMRISYSKGHVIQLSPGQLGFWPFPNKGEPDAVRYFAELVGWHRQKIQDTCRWTNDLVSRLPDE